MVMPSMVPWGKFDDYVDKKLDEAGVTREEVLNEELERRRTNQLEDIADAPEGLTTHPQEMSDKVLEARLDDLYVEALDRDIQASVTEEEEG